MEIDENVHIFRRAACEGSCSFSSVRKTWYGPTPSLATHGRDCETAQRVSSRTRIPSLDSIREFLRGLRIKSVSCVHDSTLLGSFKEHDLWHCLPLQQENTRRTLPRPGPLDYPGRSAVLENDHHDLLLDLRCRRALEDRWVDTSLHKLCLQLRPSVVPRVLGRHRVELSCSSRAPHHRLDGPLLLSPPRAQPTIPPRPHGASVAISHRHPAGVLQRVRAQKKRGPTMRRTPNR